MSISVGANLYTQGFGSRPENVEVPVYGVTAPTSSNTNFPLGKRWIAPSGEYVLTSFSSSLGVLSATWTLLGSSSSGILIALAGLTPPLSGGSVTITNPAITASSIVIFSPDVLSATSGAWGLSTGVNGSFTINSTAGSSDTTNFFYLVINS